MPPLLDTTLKQALDAALPWLDEGALRHDPVLAPVLPTVLARGVAQDWHKSGTFFQHLSGISRSLSLWRQPQRVRLLGLLHSVYGNAYVDLVKFDPQSERETLRALVGADVEGLVHRFCHISRNRFVQRLLDGHLAADGRLALEDNPDALVLSPAEVAPFIVVTLADMAEQWHSWRDDIFATYPQPQTAPLAPHWAASLWPGPMRPSVWLYTLLARLARHLQHPALRPWAAPVPVFDGGQALPAEGDEAAAQALYWSVVQHQLPLTDPAPSVAVLRQAVQRFPWVGEPRLALAQLLLAQQRFDEAHAEAAQGLTTLAQWGLAWDKRVSWAAWLAWGRLLVQSARERQWPEQLTRLNNLALHSH